jgi:hypothetical protein
LRLRGLPLIALLMVGCGSDSESDPTAVSASPPAPAAPPIPIRATPAPPPGTVDSAIVAQSLGVQVTGPAGERTQARMAGGMTMAYVMQDYRRGADGLGTYYFDSGDPTGASPDATHLAAALIDISSGPRDQPGAWLGTAMRANLLILEKQGGLMATGNLPLEAALGRWTAASWYAELRIQADPDPALFRLCWQIRLPSIERLSCGMFHRSTSAFHGIHVSDSSYGPDARVWATQ